MKILDRLLGRSPSVGGSARGTEGKCDICGRWGPLGVHSADPIVRATAAGYIPSRLPPAWEAQRGSEMLATSWRSLVNIHSASQWEVCDRCFDELSAAGTGHR